MPRVTVSLAYSQSDVGQPPRSPPPPPKVNVGAVPTVAAPPPLDVASLPRLAALGGPSHCAGSAVHWRRNGPEQQWSSALLLPASGIASHMVGVM